MIWRRWCVLALMAVSVAGLWTGFYHFGVRDEWMWVGFAAVLVLYEYTFLW